MKMFDKVGKGLAIWLLLSVLLKCTSHTIDISYMATKAGELPRGIRNNNPGNLVYTEDRWEGMSGSDGRFVIFSYMEYGVRAMAIVVTNYCTLYSLCTVGEVVNRWAPASENSVKDYLLSIQQYGGLSPDDEVDMKNLIRAMVIHENGMQLSENTIDIGIAMANSMYTNGLD